MNHWQQTRMYHCPRCGTSYKHDGGHAHACHLCPQRPARTDAAPNRCCAVDFEAGAAGVPKSKREIEGKPRGSKSGSGSGKARF